MSEPDRQKGLGEQDVRQLTQGSPDQPTRKSRRGASHPHPPAATPQPSPAEGAAETPAPLTEHEKILRGLCLIPNIVQTNQPPSTSSFAVAPDWSQDYLRAPAGKLVGFRIDTDELEPELRAGDEVLIDTSVNQVTAASLYLISIGTVRVLKRIVLHPDGSWTLRSLTAKYPDHLLPQPLAATVPVLGRVVLQGRLFPH